MSTDIALSRYLRRHIESGLPECPPLTRRWRNVLVVPAYRESPDLLQRLAFALATADATLVILVLNRPDTEADAAVNQSLRNATAALPGTTPTLHRLGKNIDLYCYDLERLAGPTPAKQGVGLARKTGCDIALYWIAQQAIASDWICCTDADALLPRDYFARLDSVDPATRAAVFPFEHTPGDDPVCNDATALYELRLHYYVLGLEYAGSPYAWHALGSCLAVRADAYAQVRGFPRRAGAEDFYLMNKVSKLGPIARLQGEAIGLRSRTSRRVPFGTGPAVNDIATSGPLEVQPRFYHPVCFDMLREMLLAVPALQTTAEADLPRTLATGGVPDSLARLASDILHEMGLETVIAHCRAHGRTQAQFLRQFHQWFDAFRTLKFIHAMRGAGWPDQSLQALPTLTPVLWPAADMDLVDIPALRELVRRHWGWRSPIGVNPADW